MQSNAQREKVPPVTNLSIGERIERWLITRKWLWKKVVFDNGVCGERYHRYDHRILSYAEGMGDDGKSGDVDKVIDIVLLRKELEKTSPLTIHDIPKDELLLAGNKIIGLTLLGAERDSNGLPIEPYGYYRVHKHKPTGKLIIEATGKNMES